MEYEPVRDEVCGAWLAASQPWTDAGLGDQVAAAPAERAALGDGGHPLGTLGRALHTDDLCALAGDAATLDAAADPRAQIDAAGARELAELDAVLAQQIAALGARFGGQIAGLDTARAAELARVDRAIGAGDAAIASDIAQARGAHVAQVGAAGRGHAAQVAGLAPDHAARADGAGEDAQRSAEQHAAGLRAQVAQRVAGSRAHHAGQVATARALGDSQAMIAIATAEARAAALPPAEAAAVRLDGQLRAIQARLEATRRADQLAAQAAAEVAALEREGAARVDGVLARAGSTGEAAQVARGHTTAQVDGAAQLAGAELVQAATLAGARLDRERGGFASEAGALRGELDATTGATRAGALGDGFVAQQAALIGLLQRHAAARQRTEQRIARLRATADASAHQLAALDRSSSASEAELAGVVGGADRRFARRIARDRAGLARAADGTRDRVGAATTAARGRVQRADQATPGELAAAADRGAQGIETAALVAGDQQAQRHAQALAQQAGATAVDGAAIDQLTALQLAASAGGAAAVPGAIDQRWAADAIAGASAQLDPGGVCDAVTDDEATRAMHLLAGLPPAARAAAIGGLPDADFATLRAELPDDRHAELAPLVTDAADPLRKLLLWQLAHPGEARRDARDDRDFDDDAAARTGDEVDGEVGRLLAAGAPQAAVDAAIARKHAEHQLELAHDVEVTADGGARADGTPNEWTQPELAIVRGNLDRLPPEHTAGSPLLHRLHRDDLAVRGGADVPSIAGDHGDGQITAYDSGTSNPAWLAQVIAHEVGHGVHDVHPEVFERYRATSGWRSLDAIGAIGDGVSPAQLAQLEAQRGAHFLQRPAIAHGGDDYVIDPYGSGYLAVDGTAIPKPGESSAPDDPWGYARTNAFDQFADHYAFAIHHPQRVHADLVARPAAEVAAREAAAQLAMEQLITGGALGLPDVLASQADLAHARAAQAQRQRQFDIMRDDVFHTSEAVDREAQRMTARGATPAQLAAFRAQAAEMSTARDVTQLSHALVP